MGAGVWRQVTIPLAALGAANSGLLTGLYLQDGSGSAQPAFWVDDISLVAVPEPTTIIAGALLLLPFGASTLRILRRNRMA